MPKVAGPSRPQQGRNLSFQVAKLPQKEMDNALQAENLILFESSTGLLADSWHLQISKCYFMAV